VLAGGVEEALATGGRLAHAKSMAPESLAACHHEGMEHRGLTGHRTKRRRRVRREVRWGVTAFVIVLVVEYLLLPELAGAGRSLHLLGRVNVAYLLLGTVLEACSLVAYAQLTHTVLPPGGPSRSRLLRIDLSSLAVSHVLPGGTAPGAGVAYRLLGESGVGGADAAFGLATQGVGSALVLNAIFWLALVISIPLNGYNPIYGIAAAAGALLLALFAATVVLLTRGRHRVIEVVRRAADRVPFLDGEQLAEQVRRIADRLHALIANRPVLYRALVWAAANWLLDAASLWVFLAAFGRLASPVDLLVAYGLANVLAVIPVTPGGLGVIEGVLIPTLAGFGLPRGVAILGVLGYRLVNFWLPIPVGAGAFLSLRLTPGGGWRQQVRLLREPYSSGDDLGEDGNTRIDTCPTSTSSLADPPPPGCPEPSGAERRGRDSSSQAGAADDVIPRARGASWRAPGPAPGTGAAH
jgi:uncharacterized protein (TIRG00374 family)